jgi:hypothetical protein
LVCHHQGPDYPAQQAAQPHRAREVARCRQPELGQYLRGVLAPFPSNYRVNVPF